MGNRVVEGAIRLLLEPISEAVPRRGAIQPKEW